MSVVVATVRIACAAWTTDSYKPPGGTMSAVVARSLDDWLPEPPSGGGGTMSVVVATVRIACAAWTTDSYKPPGGTMSAVVARSLDDWLPGAPLGGWRHDVRGCGDRAHRLRSLDD